jgi:HSP20 family molecular chaperone IbpA
MVKKEKTNKTSEEKNIGALKNEVAQKRKEIEELQKSVAEMKTQIQKKEKVVEPTESDNVVNGLMNVGFGLLGSSAAGKGEKAQGLLGLVNELGKFAEKAQVTQTTQKTINFGKGGVVDFRISSRPIRAGSTAQPDSGLNIRVPVKQSSNTHVPLPASVGTIKEREHAVDIIEEEDFIHVMVEVPNVKEDEISLNVDGKTLTVKAGTQTKTYYKKVELPTAVEKGIVKSSFRNGILEAILKKITHANQTK